jgi:hypothetical protein
MTDKLSDLKESYEAVLGHNTVAAENYIAALERELAGAKAMLKKATEYIEYVDTGKIPTWFPETRPIDLRDFLAKARLLEATQ